MTITQIARILDLHGIGYEVHNGRVIADECYTMNGKAYTDTKDVTDFTRQQLLDWLGY